MTFSNKALATLASIGVALAAGACQQGATNSTNMASANAMESTNTTTSGTDVPTVANASNSTAAAPARAGATIPANYRGVWATYAYSCADERGSGRFTITANTVLDNFHDLYEATNVESRGGGIVVLGGRDGGPGFGRIEQRYTFAMSPDGRTLTYTDRNNIETAHTRCPTAG